MADDECLTHMDFFSENFSCKNSIEIPPTDHTLHRGHLCWWNPRANLLYLHLTIQAQESSCHMGASETCTGLCADHTPNDGPIGRKETLFSTELDKRGLRGSWNGKGAPDDVGAALKRSADNLTSRDRDINNAYELFKALSERRKLLSTTVSHGQKQINWDDPEVTYDKALYPEIFLATDKNDVQVKCMRRAGITKNRLFWHPLEDVLWYPFDDVSERDLGQTD
ncbi:hypothetical protein JOB18_045263 [Solea senegalensis]|uniref:Uncharacterized protein n=1 Tax=Solea senegalensis TaxID=28829 RepID=A0AAV6S634_SOLSE|nr:hypothetical protein JOB18_045263 [Solea senegalensis]